MKREEFVKSLHTPLRNALFNVTKKDLAPDALQEFVKATRRVTIDNAEVDNRLYADCVAIHMVGRSPVLEKEQRRAFYNGIGQQNPDLLKLHDIMFPRGNPPSMN